MTRIAIHTMGDPYAPVINTAALNSEASAA